MGYHSALRPFPDFETGVQSDGSIIDLNGIRYERSDLDELLRKRQELRCAQRADDIAYIVKDSAICVIRAGVGAGKSTQITQIVYDRILGRKGIIFNTQPRVLNAMELAKRVALEWIAGTEDVAHSFGHGVGTSTGDYKNFSRDSHTVFMTDGVFLRRFAETGMPDVLMIDEAHLYTPATEHLLLMLQRYYRQEKRELKLVIMSATLDPERLRELFSPVIKNLPILDIEGASGVFHREYLGDIPVTDCAADVAKSGRNALVFVEGRAAIRKSMEELAGRMPHCRIHAMHSSVSPEERERIMALPRDPARPIVVFATNMAEDGLTFPWADVVIDSAKERVMTVDENGIPLLRTQSVSRANNTQRNGRGIGRMVWMESTTYTLGRTAPEDMRPYPQASIELVPAEQELLIVLSKGIDPLAEMEKGRNPFANRPSKRMIGRAYAALERIGAIDAKHAVTPMGTKLLDFPLHPVTGRILVEAYETEKPLRSSTLECVSIFGQRGFLSGDKEKKWRMLAGTAEKSPATDFGEIHTLFRLMMSTDPTDVDLERIRKAFVAAYGQTESDRTALRYRLNELERIKRERVPTDNEPTPPARLYERVDFSVFGIRNIDLKRIERNLARLRTALSEKGVEISDTPLLDERTLVKASLVSMSEHVFTGTKDEQGRPALRHARTGEIYSPGYSSVTAITDGQRYVATPFVAEDDEERIRIATFVSAVRPEWILEAEASNRSGSATNGETGKTAKTAKKNVDRTLLESPAAIREKYASVYGDRGNIWGNLKQTDFSKCRKQATLAAVWLADFVLAQNHGLRNYFAQRDVFLDSKTWRKKLSEMLDEVVMAHARYIDPTDRGRTERRFRSIGAEEFLHADPAWGARFIGAFENARKKTPVVRQKTVPAQTPFDPYGF